MRLSDFFKREILFIESEDLRDFTRFFLDNYVGEWFKKSGASSSGKYHPAFAQGEGGLIRHTRAVSMVCEELLRMNIYAYMRDEYKDYARVACILHDTYKYGGLEEDKNCFKRHGFHASVAISNAWFEFFGDNAPEILLMAVRSHMGQWTEPKEDRPFTNVDRLVHLADYVASRSFWDIPTLTAEYEADAHPEDVIVEYDDAELPF